MLNLHSAGYTCDYINVGMNALHPSLYHTLTSEKFFYTDSSQLLSQNYDGCYSARLHVSKSFTYDHEIVKVKSSPCSIAVDGTTA